MQIQIFLQYFIWHVFNTIFVLENLFSIKFFLSWHNFEALTRLVQEGLIHLWRETTSFFWDRFEPKVPWVLEMSSNCKR